MPGAFGGDSVRLLLVEDHPMVSIALRAAFELVEDIDLVATAGSVAATIATASELRPQVILLDRRLPDGDGIDAIPRLRSVCPESRVLVFTGYATRAMVDRVMAVGGAGLVLKDGMFEDLAAVIRRVAAGQDCFDTTLGH
ncbi:response regulator [Nocardia terpenica]|uniref:Response regulator n=1 Tax=Nocardia terpenica TaxID=455432 RepID=A0A6G9Z489_9NOCA|nr:response regulator transcription factor [Nocardia terpenica]QIS20006.1 response regulator [Nocardia terpenica]